VEKMSEETLTAEQQAAATEAATAKAEADKAASDAAAAEAAKTPEQKTAEKEAADKAAADAEAAKNKPHKDRFQIRINQLTSKIKVLEARLEGSQQGRASQEQQPIKPVREQYQNDEAYIDALTDYKLSLRLPEVQRNIHEAGRNATSHTAFQAKEIQARKEIEDYDDAIAEAADIPVQGSVADAILSSDIGPHLRYYLATHPDEAETLNSMSAGAAARQIGKIEAKLESEIAVKKTAKKKVSGAPPPVKPVHSGGDAGGAVDLNDPKMSMDDWLKKRREQRAKAHAPLKRTA
jgi:hypothetical protein